MRRMLHHCSQQHEAFVKRRTTSEPETRADKARKHNEIDEIQAHQVMKSPDPMRVYFGKHSH